MISAKDHSFPSGQQRFLAKPLAPIKKRMNAELKEKVIDQGWFEIENILTNDDLLSIAMNASNSFLKISSLVTCDYQ